MLTTAASVECSSAPHRESVDGARNVHAMQQHRHVSSGSIASLGGPTPRGVFDLRDSPRIARIYAGRTLGWVRAGGGGGRVR